MDGILLETIERENFDGLLAVKCTVPVNIFRINYMDIIIKFTFKICKEN